MNINRMKNGILKTCVCLCSIVFLMLFMSQGVAAKKIPIKGTITIRNAPWLEEGTNDLSVAKNKSFVMVRFKAPVSGTYAFTISNLKTNGLAASKDLNTLDTVLAKPENTVPGSNKPWPKWKSVQHDAKCAGKKLLELKIGSSGYCSSEENTKLKKSDPEKRYTSNTATYSLSRGSSIALYIYTDEDFKKNGYQVRLNVKKK